MNNKSGSERLKAWVHWKLLEKDLDEDDRQFALDIQALQKVVEEQKWEIAELRAEWHLATGKLKQVGEACDSIINTAINDRVDAISIEQMKLAFGKQLTAERILGML